MLILKSSNNSILCCYKTNSLLPQFNKDIRKLFEKNINQFPIKKMIVNNGQCVFRHNTSTVTALVDITKSTLPYFDTYSTLATSNDLKKTLDTIDYDILNEKGEHMGIRGIVLELRQSYLQKMHNLI